jgi:DNA-binding NarL/FixJ family response regulator
MDAPPVQYVRTSDGYDIAYGISGLGQPLVSMPGPFSHFQAQWTSESYRPRFEALAADYRLIHYDCRGQGMSTRGLPEPPLLDYYYRDLEAVMSKLGSERVILYGPALSGAVAVRYAVENPERLLALILVGVTLDDPLEGARTLEHLAQESWDNFLKILAYNFYRSDTPERALSILRDSMSQEDFLRHMQLPAKSLRRLLPQVSVPTLVLAIQGAYGPPGKTGEEEGKNIAALVPDASLVVVKPSETIMKGGEHRWSHAIHIQEFIARLPDRCTDFTSASPVVEKGLSPREIEVLRLLAAGRSNQHIADELVISLNTVRRHVSNIFDKTGAANRAQATAYAKDRGLA